MSLDSVSALLGGIGQTGVEATSGVKKSPSALMKAFGQVPVTPEEKPTFMQRAMKGDLTDMEMLGLSAAGTGISTAAGLYDTNQQFKRSRSSLEKNFVQSMQQDEARAEFRETQSQADFEQAMQQREAQFQLTQEVREKQFNASMDMIAERSGIAKDQLMNDVQFSQTVANINELNSLLNLAKQQQPAGENTQQFFS